MSETIGFIGLGALGLPIANNLLNEGYSLRVHNRTASKADPLVARGAQLMTKPADVVTAGGIVVTVLWDDAAVESIVTSAEFLDRLGPGGIHISMSTISPEAARRLAQLHAQKGCVYLEAPIFGRPEAAIARKLLIPLAGAEDKKARVRPLLTAMGASGIFDFGEAAGAAVTVKLAGNFLIMSAARSFHEALVFAQKSHVDPKAVVDMLTTTLFAAPIYQSYGKFLAQMLVDKIPLQHSDIPLKDVGIFRNTAAQLGVATPIAGQIYELLKNA